MSLLKKTTKHGSVSRMYQSVDHIGVSYLQLLPGADKSELLQPKVVHSDARELAGGSVWNETTRIPSSSPPPLWRWPQLFEGVSPLLLLRVVPQL